MTTNLTEARASLKAYRNKVGAESRDGRLISTAAELTEAIESYERPAWAEHPMQTPMGLLAWQLERLKGA